MEIKKEEIHDLIIERGGPVSTIDFLISKLNDENLIQTTEYIKYILSVRTVSKKTYIGDVNFYDYLINNGIIL
jgi:hypothetical protein